MIMGEIGPTGKPYWGKYLKVFLMTKRSKEEIIMFQLRANFLILVSFMLVFKGKGDRNNL